MQTDSQARFTGRAALVASAAACLLTAALLPACGDDDDTENPRTLEEPENHRPVAVACPQERASIEPAPRGEDEPPLVGCEVDSDCTDGDNGRCTPVNRSSEYECTYDTCFEDADCNDALCACRQPGTIGVNFCMPGNCQTDADCGDDGYCSPTQGECGSYFGTIGYYCRTLDDECLNDSDCMDPNGDSVPGYCMFSPSAEHWVCGYGQCVGK